MELTGSLRVAARWAAGETLALTVTLRRPAVPRLFVGRSPAAVLELVPTLYSLCARAQRQAAGLALAAAAGTPAPAGDADLWDELVHEVLWRLCLDWPRVLGAAPLAAAFAAWRAAARREGTLAACRAAEAGEIGHLMKKWAEFPVDRESLPPLPPPLDPAAWRSVFEAAASWPPLVGPVTVLAARAQRVAEWRLAVDALADRTPCPVASAGGGGVGIGQVWTARGVLTHAVRLRDGQVVDYRVWAPTDRHFADADGLSRLLAGRSFPALAVARQAVEQAILALDPCLPYELEMDHA